MAAVLQLHALHQVARSASIRTRRLVRKKRSLQLLGGGAAAHLIHNGPTSGQHEQEGAEETRVSNERFHHSVVNDRNWAAGGALPAGAASQRPSAWPRLLLLLLPAGLPPAATNRAAALRCLRPAYGCAWLHDLGHAERKTTKASQQKTAQRGRASSVVLLSQRKKMLRAGGIWQLVCPQQQNQFYVYT